MIDPSAAIHPKAHVEGATIGARSRVWQFASVIRGAVLGADCNVSAGAHIDGTRIGDRCLIMPGVALFPGYVIGSDVFIGPNTTGCNDAWPTVDKTGMDLGRMQSGEFVTVRIGNKVTIGANVVILPGVTIEDGAMIAAGAVVNSDVPRRFMWLRDGSLRPIERTPRRMREAHPC